MVRLLLRIVAIIESNQLVAAEGQVHGRIDGALLNLIREKDDWVSQMWAREAPFNLVEHFFECPTDFCKGVNRKEDAIFEGRKRQDEESVWKDHSEERVRNIRVAADQRWIWQEGPGVVKEEARIRQSHQINLENPR